MKKLMLAMAIVAGAVSAQAATTYNIKQMNAPWSSKYSQTLGDKDMAYFSAYGMSASQVSQMIGTTVNGGVLTKDEATANANLLADWINDNFNLAMEKMAAANKEFTNMRITISSENKYQTGTYTDSSSSKIKDSWQEVQYVVDFYTGSKLDDVSKGAFRVAVIKDASSSTDSAWEISGANKNNQWIGWQTTTVPEPTSGLLMLLGVAGLALKRKRA